MKLTNRQKEYIKHLVSRVRYWFMYMTINNFKKYSFPSIFWSIRKHIRKLDPFNYWTRFRRIENGACPECGQFKKL